LTSLDIGDNMLCDLYSDGSGTYNGAGVAALSDVLKVNSVLKELNMSKASIGPEGAKVLSLGLSGNRALTSLHVGQSNIPQKEMREIIAIAMRMDSMKILCEVPFKDKTLSELDVSGKNLGMEGALVVADYLDGNEALTALNLSSNNLHIKSKLRGAGQVDEGGKIVAEAIKVTINAMEIVV
jgi:Ran GTPase-activating protein (RanGAP) involved in mRNA processing and transport